jgi:hypothetical protein
MEGSKGMEAANFEIDRLRQDNIRLRTALVQIGNLEVTGWNETPDDTRYLRLVDRAREALSQ